MAKVHFIDHLELQVTTSIDISIYPDHGRVGETLIKNADAAMQHAKNKGLWHGVLELELSTPLPNRHLEYRSVLIRQMDSADGVSMVKAIVQLARTGHADGGGGVESEQEAKMLEDSGCDTAQGYLFSRPLPAEQLEKMPGIA